MSGAVRPWTSPGQSHSTHGSFQLPAAEKHTSALQRPREGRQEEPRGSDVGNLEGCGSCGTTGYTPPTLTLQPGHRHQAALGRQVLAAPHSFPGKPPEPQDVSPPLGPQRTLRKPKVTHTFQLSLRHPLRLPPPQVSAGSGDGTTGRGGEGREGRQKREHVMRDFTTTMLQKVRETWEVRPRAGLPHVERTQALECPRHAFTFLLRHIAPCDLGEGKTLMSPSEPCFLHFTKQWPGTVPGAGRESDDPRLFRALRLPS